MFALIPVLFAIALIAIVTVAVIWSGGDAFSDGGQAASASAIINQASTVANSVDLHKAQNAGALPADMTELVTEGFLATEPGVGLNLSWTLNSTTGELDVTGTNLSEALCLELENQFVQPDVTTLATAEPTGRLAGCYNDSTNGPTFFYN